MLRGWLYRPRGRAAAAPAVVMAHGYNCIKELYLDRYAAAIADAGHVVLAYDHRNFGDSDGEPRQELHPWMQVRDYVTQSRSCRRWTEWTLSGSASGVQATRAATSSSSPQSTLRRIAPQA